MSDGIGTSELFHLPHGSYLLSHSVGAQPKAVEADLLSRHLAPWQQQGGDAWPAWLDAVETFCQSLADLLGGSAEQYCPQSNLSSAMTKYLTALPRDPKRNQVLMHANAFPSMGFVVQALQPFGLELVLIDESLAADDPQVWEDHLNDKTLAALITHVHSNTGVLSPVEPLVVTCKRRGVKAMVDVAQSSGIVPFDLSSWQADVVFGSCVKWLCGGPGAGFMWVNPSQLEALMPPDVGWFSHQNPFEFDIRHFTPASDAKRFWGGTPAVAPYVIATTGVQLIHSIGVERIHAHNRHLLAQVLDFAGTWMTSEVDLSRNGGTLCASFSSDVADKLEAALKANQAYFDRRGNTLRLSFHIYNTQQDLDLLEGLFRRLG